MRFTSKAGIHTNADAHFHIMNGAQTRRGGSGGGGVGANGFTAYNPGRMPPPAVQPLVSPPGKVLVEGYRKDIITGFEKGKPRHNAVCASPAAPHTFYTVEGFKANVI